jgi:hypothetical protein
MKATPKNRPHEIKKTSQKKKKHHKRKKNRKCPQRTLQNERRTAGTVSPHLSPLPLILPTKIFIGPSATSKIAIPMKNKNKKNITFLLEKMVTPMTIATVGRSTIQT